MPSSSIDIAGTLARRCARICADHARIVVGAALALCLASVLYVAGHLGINTDSDDMLSADLPFRQNSIAMDAAFPQLSGNLAIVLDGRDPDRLDEAARRMLAALAARRATLGDALDPEAEPLFRRNGLLYESEDELSDLLDRLIAAQPFLGKLWNDPTLPGLFATIGLILDESDTPGGSDTAITATPVLRDVAATIRAEASGTSRPLSWSQLIAGEAASDKRHFRAILLQPNLDYESLAPGGEAIATVRAIATELDLEHMLGVRTRLTGSVALEHEELGSLRENMGLASVLSFVMVGALLVWAMRSARLVLATLATLAAGLIVTAGWAALSVGELNLISVAFAVLFIGLGVDFGVHFALRFREETARESSVPTALAVSAADIGGALALSAVTAAIGFFSFIPTDYRGLAELGIIAGGGMFVALVANLTLLPALLSLFPPKSAPPVDFEEGDSGRKSGAEPSRLIAATRRLALPAALVIVALSLASALLAPWARFDFDPMNLRDPESESISTLHDMMEAGGRGPYTIEVLAENLAAADELAAKLQTLKTVDGTVTLSDYVPRNQDEKIAMISSAALTILPALSIEPVRARASDEERLAAFAALRRSLTQYLREQPKGDLASAAQALLDSLAAFATRTQLNAAALSGLERALIGSLVPRLMDLKMALDPTGVSLDDIPKTLRDRQVAADGRAIVEIQPKADIRDRDNLRAFVEDVRTVAPGATGAPVIILEAGSTVVRAFFEAGAWSLLAISILAFAILRRARDVLFIYAPLFLAAFLTLGATVLFSMPFNFANVIVLPLLFGLGIASGIHLVLRERKSNAALGVVETSTPRAVFFSTMTTVASFGTIALSNHPGTASMGILLTISIAFTLICSLTVLPALLQRWPVASKRDAG